LWLSWRSVRLDPLIRTVPATLVGTLKRAEPRRLAGWHYLAALPLLLLFRAWVYWQIGSAVNWMPKLDLGVIALPFRSDLFRPALAYSVLGFVRLMLIFYCWLLVISAITRRAVSVDPILRLIRLQLGRVAGWPGWLQLFIPLLLVAGLWAAFQPLLIQAGLTNRAQSNLALLERCLLIGGSVYLSLKYILPVLLLSHLVVSYVYLGRNPFWDFVGTTSRHLLTPIRWLPLRSSKLDFAPLLGIILVLLLLHTLPNLLLRHLLARNLTLWPA
jgi:uncharacterized protein YggT (Ycf19 family)